MPNPAFKYLLSLYLSFKYRSPLYSTPQEPPIFVIMFHFLTQIDPCSSPFTLYQPISFACNDFLP